MSDTMDFLESQGSTSTDIDLAALAANLDQLSMQELVGICSELGLPTAVTANGNNEENYRTSIRGYMDQENGTANVTDITHEKESVMTTHDIPNTPVAQTPMVEGAGSTPESDSDGNLKITKYGKLYWVNPYTGNRVANGYKDTDRRADIKGYAVVSYEPNPNELPKPDAYDEA